MTLQEWGSLGELVGGVAVIVTLIYLAVQTRQARREAWAQAPQWISDGFRSWMSAPREDAELAELLIRGLQDWSNLSATEQFRVHAWWSEKIVHLDAILTLHEQGLIDDTRSRAWVDDTLSFICTAGGTAWWSDAKILFTPQVREELERRLEDPGTLPPAWTETLPWFRSGDPEKRAHHPGA
jgi:hypothetical protein